MLTGLEAIFFYVFAFILIASAAMVVTARNPVHSVLWLILAFFNAAALFLIAGAEFLAMILVIVYVGAVAVLFLFVVMMLDIDFARLREGFRRNAPLGLVIGVILLIELLMVFAAWRYAPEAAAMRLQPVQPEGVTNTEALGRVLYTDHVYPFQLAGLVLLVAMIGAIVLTLRERPTAKRQDVAAQVARSGSVVTRRVPIGAGLAETGIARPLPPEPARPNSSQKTVTKREPASVSRRAATVVRWTARCSPPTTSAPTATPSSARASWKATKSSAPSTRAASTCARARRRWRPAPGRSGLGQ